MYTSFLRLHFLKKNTFSRTVYLKHNKISYYFDFKMHLFSHFSEIKIRARLKLEVLFTLRKPRKHHCPRKTRGLAKRVVNFTDSEMEFLAKIVHIFNSLMNSLKRYLLIGNYHPTFSLKSLFKSGVCLTLKGVYFSSLSHKRHDFRKKIY